MRAGVLVFTFPGQGSQRSGMGRAWVDHPSWEVVAEASTAAGRDLAALLLDAPMEELTATANAQLATFVQSLVVLDAVERLGLSPRRCAGHSLGEYTALVASGAISFEDGVRLVVARGEAMARAGEDAPGTMAALLGIADDDAEAACQRAEGDVWVANYNAPGQVVIAGTTEARGHRAGELAKDSGARRVMPIPVSGAFHTPLMAGGPRRLRKALGDAVFLAPEIPVVANVDARVHIDPASGRAALGPAVQPGPLAPVPRDPGRPRRHHLLSSSGPAGCSPAWPGGWPPSSRRVGGRARRPRHPHGRRGHARAGGPDATPTRASTSTCPSGWWSARAAASSPPSRRCAAPGHRAAARAPRRRTAPGGTVGHRAWATWSAGSASTEVRTPFAGEVVRWLATAGERVQEGQPLLWLRVLGDGPVSAEEPVDGTRVAAGWCSSPGGRGASGPPASSGSSPTGDRVAVTYRGPSRPPSRPGADGASPGRPAAT